MKNILLAVRPKWVEKICHEIGKDENGKPIYEKRIEVRKSAPKEVPFKAYIYCTKASKKYQTICGCMVINTDELYRLPNGKIKHDWSGELMCFNGEYTRDNFLNGKVIGEFVCDKVYNIEPIFSFYYSYSGYDDSDDSCYFEDYSIDKEVLEKTCLTKEDLYIYGNGKTLYAWHISDLKIYDKPLLLSELGLNRPPQSYMFVEEVER